MTPAEDRFAALLRAFREQLSSRVPGWTDTNASDPGNSLLELFALLTERVSSIASTLPGEARAELARVGARLVELDRSADAVDLRVDGTRWAAVSSLSDAAPDARVFALDPATGAVQFGDGIHGATPPDGATVTATYRAGGGTTGNVGVTLTSRWPFEEATLNLSATRDGRVRVFCPAPQAPQPPQEPQEPQTPEAGLERVEFFQGRLLAVADLADEQHYMRTKLRRLNQAAFDVGVVKGLEVSVSNDAQGALSVVVEPGSALDPSGELIVVDGPVSCAAPVQTEPQVVLLRYVEQLTSFIPVAGEDGMQTLLRATRTAEGFAVSIEPEADAAAVLLARLVPAGGGWTVE